MALQNIGASNRDDAFYRYKMPRMITKIEGRGNGIKTNIVNMLEIAKALARPASYTTKYFGCELGAQSKFDEKTGTSHVNGAHDTAKLAGLLENFIKKYVQCYGCGNPETEIIITKNQMIQLKCAACGFISDVDMRDKLTTFIIKNPPEQKKGSKKEKLRKAEKERLKEGEVADEEQKKLKKDATKKKPTKDGPSKVATTKKKTRGSDEEPSPAGSQSDGNDSPGVEDKNDVDDEDDVEWQTDTSLEAARQRIQEQLSAVTTEMVILSTEDVKPVGKKPVEEKSSKKKSPGPEPELKPETKEIINGTKSEDPHQKLVGEIKEFLKSSPSAGQLKSRLGSLSGGAQEVMNAVFEALFDGVPKGFAKEVAEKNNYIAAAVQDEGSQLLLLNAIESFCGKARPNAVKETAMVLKALYDADLLEEEYIVQWYQQGLVGDNKSSTVWKNVKPFVEWLQSAESESESEEE